MLMPCDKVQARHLAVAFKGIEEPWNSTQVIWTDLTWAPAWGTIYLPRHFYPSIILRSWHYHPLPATSGDSWNTSSPQAFFVSEKHHGNGWLHKKSSVCCRLGQCLSRPTLSSWGYFSICLMPLREVQGFFFFQNVWFSGLSIVIALLGKTDIQSLTPTPCPIPDQAQAGA